MAKIRDKTPPHDDELERAALGSMLFDEAAVEAARENGLKADDFYSRGHRRIYEAVVGLSGRSLRPDIQTVIQELRAQGRLDEAGGGSYVSSLTSVIPSGANIEYYVQSVQDHSLRRALLLVASAMGAGAYDESRNSLEILDEIEKSVFELREEDKINIKRKKKRVNAKKCMSIYRYSSIPIT
jgi:replicative DNA helicase